MLRIIVDPFRNDIARDGFDLDPMRADGQRRKAARIVFDVFAVVVADKYFVRRGSPGGGILIDHRLGKRYVAHGIGVTVAKVAVLRHFAVF